MLLPNQHRDCHQWKRSCLGPPSKYLCKMCSNMFGDGEFLNLLTSISVCLFSDSSPNSLTDPEWNSVKQQHVLPANTLQIRSAAPWDFRSSCSSRRQPEKVCWYRLEQGLGTRWGSWLIRLHAHTPQVQLPFRVTNGSIRLGAFLPASSLPSTPGPCCGKDCRKGLHAADFPLSFTNSFLSSLFLF